MDNRYRSSGGQQDRDRYGSRNRQDEQFSASSDDQYGEPSWRTQENERWQSSNDYDRGYGRNQPRGGSDWSRQSDPYRDEGSSYDDYDRFSGSSSYGQQDRQHSSFGGGQGSYSQNRNRGGYGTDRSHSSSFGSSSYRPGGSAYGGSSYGSSTYGTSSYRNDRSSGRSEIPPREYDRDERGFFERASDEVMSWFGDDEAARRRRMDGREDHRGKGPSGYTRSKERILEDANERLMHDSDVDASKINVACENGEITLSGSVDSRSAKRRAEDIVENVSGVKHVQNNLRVESRDSYYGQSGTTSQTGSAGSSVSGTSSAGSTMSGTGSTGSTVSGTGSAGSTGTTKTQA